MSKKIIPLTETFIKARPVLEKIIAAGYEAYFVGGSIRDALLGLPVNDVDIATSATPDEVKEIFKRTVDLGIEHGTVMVLWGGEQYEVTTFRTESTYKDFRRPESVTFVRSLEEDLKRRDFTMNAMALDVNGKVFDFWGGQEDIRRQLIKTVGNADERFSEDALRMMRAVRFQSQLGFKIDQTTAQAIRTHGHLLEKIAAERIQVEFEKLLLGNYRNNGLLSLITTHLYQHCLNLRFHLKGLKEMLTAGGIFQSDVEAWSAVVWYFSKINTESPFSISAFLREWKLSNRLIKNVKHVVWGLHTRPTALEDAVNYLYEIGPVDGQLVEKLREAMKCPNDVYQFKVLYNRLPIKSADELVINGRDVLVHTQKRPGPWVGEVLERMIQEVLHHHLPNDRESLLVWLTDNVDNLES